jgi:ubiquinone/menaquinone biosynthesis C-methylase UbiE
VSREDVAKWFAETYARMDTAVHRAVQREVFGADSWVRGYTTPAQADLLAERLALRPGLRVLDVGAGLGWPSLYLAQRTGCETVLTDVPEPGLRSALIRAERLGLSRRPLLARASGTHLPFSPRSFDAVVHTDAL